MADGHGEELLAQGGVDGVAGSPPPTCEGVVGVLLLIIGKHDNNIKAAARCDGPVRPAGGCVRAAVLSADVRRVLTEPCLWVSLRTGGKARRKWRRGTR